MKPELQLEEDFEETEALGLDEEGFNLFLNSEQNVSLKQEKLLHMGFFNDFPDDFNEDDVLKD
uniref:Uncharacterized protein n=1 Tax=Tetraselmis sp. GSL018 TaxID=582737 RepID=A0A061RUL1_9CHLO|eukprot:CAMPEP_0177619754 /NCGR_PEP_ID=MMETSP0419_2-20121207/26467_1 /TAXON_ID=582737 /ORGANISM="Tetraselmis sp., Strain GSL018" /LENGTH=62 /DNA_ID=CAMNT_0019119119 /DNA_START=33 /DNA_END=221 /DNA_ORIENTATION=-